MRPQAEEHPYLGKKEKCRTVPRRVPLRRTSARSLTLGQGWMVSPRGDADGMARITRWCCGTSRHARIRRECRPLAFFSGTDRNYQTFRRRVMIGCTARSLVASNIIARRDSIMIHLVKTTTVRWQTRWYCFGKAAGRGPVQNRGGTCGPKTVSGPIISLSKFRYMSEGIRPEESRRTYVRSPS